MNPKQLFAQYHPLPICGVAPTSAAVRATAAVVVPLSPPGHRRVTLTHTEVLKVSELRNIPFATLSLKNDYLPLIMQTRISCACVPVVLAAPTSLVTIYRAERTSQVVLLIVLPGPRAT